MFTDNSNGALNKPYLYKNVYGQQQWRARKMTPQYLAKSDGEVMG